MLLTLADTSAARTHFEMQHEIRYTRWEILAGWHLLFILVSIVLGALFSQSAWIGGATWALIALTIVTTSIELQRRLRPALILDKQGLFVDKLGPIEWSNVEFINRYAPGVNFDVEKESDRIEGDTWWDYGIQVGLYCRLSVETPVRFSMTYPAHPSCFVIPFSRDGWNLRDVRIICSELELTHERLFDLACRYWQEAQQSTPKDALKQRASEC